MDEPYIGTQEFLAMRNCIPYAGELPIEITRPNTPGVAFRIDGLRARPATIQTRTLCYSDAAVDDAQYAYALMQGYIYEVGDEFGNTRSNVIIMEYRPVRAIMTLVGSTSPAGVYGILDSEWLVQDIDY